MPGFCPRCGKVLDGPVAFCPACGTPLAAQPAPSVAPGRDRSGVPAPGWSDRVNDPEILAAVRKNRKAAGIFGLFFVPLPLLGFVIYALVSKKMEVGSAALYGGIVSFVFLLFALFGLRSQRAENSYEAVVTDQRSQQVKRHKDTSTTSRYGWVTQYTTYAQTVDGHKKKIVETSDGRVWAWNYLKIGDRFRYHPQFAFPYERYVKADADCLYCVVCQTRNPITADRCSHCGKPLLK